MISIKADKTKTTNNFSDFIKVKYWLMRQFTITESDPTEEYTLTHKQYFVNLHWEIE